MRLIPLEPAKSGYYEQKIGLLRTKVVSFSLAIARETSGTPASLQKSAKTLGESHLFRLELCETSIRGDLRRHPLPAEPVP